jgi:hypothetical protein
MVMGVRLIGDHGAPSFEAFVAEVCTQNIEAEYILEICQGWEVGSYWLGGDGSKLLRSKYLQRYTSTKIKFF